MSKHHEVPTHLNVEDKVLYGLTVRQFLYLLVGSSATYTLWQQSDALPLPMRALLAATCVLVTLAFGGPTAGGVVCRCAGVWRDAQARGLAAGGAAGR